MDIRAFIARHGNTIALFLILALIVLIWFIAPRSAKADGYADGYRDPYARTSRLRSEPIYYHRETIRDHLSPSEKAELRRIHGRALRRMQADRDAFARTIHKSPKNRRGNHRYPYADQRFYDEKSRQGTRYARRAVTSDAYEVREGRECRAAIEATGHERLGRGRAEKSARNAWRTAVIDRPGLGGRFSDLGNAAGVKKSCYLARGDVFKIFVCSVRARPCRGM